MLGRTCANSAHRVASPRHRPRPHLCRAEAVSAPRHDRTTPRAEPPALRPATLDHRAPTSDTILNSATSRTIQHRQRRRDAKFSNTACQRNFPQHREQRRISPDNTFLICQVTRIPPNIVTRLARRIAPKRLRFSVAACYKSDVFRSGDHHDTPHPEVGGDRSGAFHERSSLRPGADLEDPERRY